MWHAVSHDMDKGGCMQPWLNAMDANGGGMISKDEFMKAHEAMFDKISDPQERHGVGQGYADPDDATAHVAARDERQQDDARRQDDE